MSKKNQNNSVAVGDEVWAMGKKVGRIVAVENDTVHCDNGWRMSLSGMTGVFSIRPKSKRA